MSIMSRKNLYWGFWILGIIMVTGLIYFTANLGKEVPPLPQIVASDSGEVLYTYDDIVQGKGHFQQFGLMDYGSLLGMGAYLGPDFTTQQMHGRILTLYDIYGRQIYNKSIEQLTEEEKGFIKSKVIKDVRSVQLNDQKVVYSKESSQAFSKNKAEMIDFLVSGNHEWAWRGGVISKEEAESIVAFIDWSQLAATTLRPNTQRTWTNNWPNEPLIDQDLTWNVHSVTLWEWLLLWPATILVIFLAYEYIFKRKNVAQEELGEPLQINGIYPSQEKLLKYVPVVALFSLLQLVLGGYLAHIYIDPAPNFIVPQDWLPFNIVRQMHLNLAIIWVTIGWLVGGLLIAPIVAGEDLRFPKLVDFLWWALLIVGGGGLIGIYLGSTGHLRSVWFWFGSEGREYLELGRVWDIGLLLGLLFWFGLVFSTIRKAKNDLLVGTTIWSAFGVATLYIAGMMPIHKLIPNFTIDDYYRWWVVHLWVELTFELFAAGVLAYLSVALGLVRRSAAEKIMLFEILLIVATGILGVGHHYWWQGAEEYWIAFGGIFSALEPLPLILLMIEAIKEQRDIKQQGKAFAWSVPFLWLAGSAFLNWYGAGWLGMIINTPTMNYYSHGTYLIIPHAHVALLGAFGYISYAFIYMAARTNALAKGLVWKETVSKWGFWLLTTGVVVYSIPTLIIGLYQTQVSFELGYYATRLRETLEAVKMWMWLRIVPDGMMIAGGTVVLYDLINKIYLVSKKQTREHSVSLT